MSSNTTKTGERETVDKLTKDMELVDIGGEEFSLVFLADRFKKCQEDEGMTVQ